MKQILVWCLLGLMMATNLAAQTRRIGHRSHSGNPATFAMMMEEDHLGDKKPMPVVLYHVDPFVQRVRAHYEKVAKSIPASTEAAPPQSTPDSSAAPPKETPSPATQSPQPSKHRPKQQDEGPRAAVPDIPAPDFLVQARPHTAPTVEATEGATRPAPAPGESRLWMLAALLACTVAPGIFLTSALMQRRPS